VQRRDVSGRIRSDNLQFPSTSDQNRCLILILNLHHAMGETIRVENVILTSDSDDRPCKGRLRRMTYLNIAI